MNLIEQLACRWRDAHHPVLIHPKRSVTWSEIANANALNLSAIHPGDVVALIGDFDPDTILVLLQLIDRNAIVMPLTTATRAQHPFFFEQALVDVVIEGQALYRRQHGNQHRFIDELRGRNKSGLILFSTGTTGEPKAILHDMTYFLQRYETPRPPLRTLGFLLFDHIGGLNTLLHTLFNSGVVIALRDRTIESVLEACERYEAEVLPTTPTFLRMMLLSGLVPERFPASLRVVTYGTEMMDQTTLDALCDLLPSVDFRQTYGMSELGIVRVKSKSRNSLYMRIGGEGVETRVVDGVLHIRSKTRMIGYLNAPSPFDADGWYDTQDVVAEEDGFFKIMGRTNNVINAGGLKFMAADVENIAIRYPGIFLAKASARSNPITGQHVELRVQPQSDVNVDKRQLQTFLEKNLPQHMIPRRLTIGDIDVGHRFKRS